MEGFKYVDIFATKGIEYIAAIAFLITLVLFWRWLNRPSVAKVSANSQNAERISLVDWFRLADGFYYHQGHSWLRPDSDGVVTVGIDDFAQKLLGKPSEVNLPTVGSHLHQGEKGLQLQIDGQSVDVLSPVDGEVIAVNDQVRQSPALVNGDPYQKGWLLKVKSSNLNKNLKNLLHGNIAKAWVEDTVNRLSRTISNDYGVVLQDGGTITSGFIRELSAENWQQMAREFLLTNDT